MFKEKVKNFYRTKGFAIYDMILILLDAILYLLTVEKSLIKIIKFRNDLNTNNNEILINSLISKIMQMLNK